MNIFHYYISHKNNPVDDKMDVWQSFLPYNRRMNAASDDASQVSITCGEYFSAITEFLSSENFHVLTQAIGAGFEKQVSEQDINKIHVMLIKHGEFYHPARIEVDAKPGDQFDFVLNVAVSENGRALIAEEYTNLNSLDLLFSYPFLPKTYFMGGINIREDRELPMFLAQWCKGHREFHWSKLPESDELGIVVWDDEKGNRFLDRDQTVTLFGQAAMILTCYYNFSSSYQISMWHHAAGDFVVQVNDKNVSAKLISVRQYAPMIELDDPDMWTLLETLFIFFIHLTIRMRLDRMDGVGETVWGNDLAVMGAVEGFIMGLRYQVANEQMPEELFDGIRSYLKTFSQENILEWCTNIANQVYKNAPDLDFMLARLDEHARQLHQYLGHYLKDS